MTAAQLHGKRILIVEDEPALLKVLKKKLGELNCEILTAEDGVEAMDIIKKENPEVILLDIVMPKKNGFDVLKELRTQLQKETPVVIISNLERPEDIEMGKSFGVKKYIVKSNISIRQLVSMVSAIVDDVPNNRMLKPA